jgi:hypothetical protein
LRTRVPNDYVTTLWHNLEDYCGSLHRRENLISHMFFWNWSTIFRGGFRVRSKPGKMGAEIRNQCCMSRGPDLWRMQSDIRVLKKKKSSLACISEQKLRKLVVKLSWTRLLYLQSVRKVGFVGTFTKRANTTSPSVVTVWKPRKINGLALYLLWMRQETDTGFWWRNPQKGVTWKAEGLEDNINALKFEIQLIVIRNWAEPHKERVRLAETIQLILFTEIIAVYSENQTKRKNILFWTK